MFYGYNSILLFIKVLLFISKKEFSSILLSDSFSSSSSPSSSSSSSSSSSKPLLITYLTSLNDSFSTFISLNSKSSLNEDDINSDFIDNSYGSYGSDYSDDCDDSDDSTTNDKPSFN
jgi:hypothetical protein